MEINVEDLTIGYQEKIDFSKLRDDANEHSASFLKMANRSQTSLVIVYQWVDEITKTYDDRSEAFYIDNVNDENREKAIRIFTDVYDGLQLAFEEDPNQNFEMAPLVETTVKNNSQSMHK